MIDDLLDQITDANILIISEHHLDNISTLLKANHYQSIQVSNDFQAAMAMYMATLPDLVIISALENLPALELADKLNTFNEINNPPPVLLINESNTPPPFDSSVKDFINTPVNANELLFRTHRLLTAYLSCQELHCYNESIIKAIQQRSQELKESQIEVIECLGYAAEFRDSETGMHTIRVGHYSQCLAKAMGMNDKEAESLLYSAPMHDVGKIGIPDKVLLKPGRLEGKEWEVMKRHASIGERILNRSNNKLLQQASIIAANHHEKWDGSGYPKGLKGTDIHLYGRIVAIVDVFDALTMERPYKKAWTIDSAIELIKSESGKHFDPTLVQLFIDNIDDIIAIKNKYADTDQNTTNDLLNEYLSV